MKELEKTYNPAAIEERLYQKWLDKKYFHAKVDRTKKPFTIMMPPPNITFTSVEIAAWSVPGCHRAS